MWSTFCLFFSGGILRNRSILWIFPETLVLETGPELTVEIPVEVLWKPDQCSQCGVFGNSTTKCLKRPAKQQWVVKGKNVILAISIVEIGRIK
jgi:hypothetical protein